MKLTDFINETDKLPTDQKGAILKIIDLKTEQDMKEFILAMEQVKTDLERMQHETERNMERIRHDTEKSINRNTTLLFWLLGVIGAGIVTGITIFLTYLQSK